MVQLQICQPCGITFNCTGSCECPIHPVCRCGHCRNLAPRWVTLADSLKGVVKVAAINCEAEQALCAKHG